MITNVATNMLSKFDGSDQFATSEITRRVMEREITLIVPELIGIIDVDLPAQAGNIAEKVIRMDAEMYSLSTSLPSS